MNLGILHRRKDAVDSDAGIIDQRVDPREPFVHGPDELSHLVEVEPIYCLPVESISGRVLSLAILDERARFPAECRDTVAGCQEIGD